MNLKPYRLKNKERQSDVAAFLGVERSTYTKYENGSSEPPFAVLRLLSDHWSVSVDELLDGKKSPALPEQDGRDPEDAELDSLLPRLTRDQKRMLVAQLRLLADESK